MSKSGATAVDPANIDWSDQAELRRLLIRQRPGASNALGRVKFLFPNPYHVYLHDTPAGKLFTRPVRALSHGCVRVEEPEKLAAYVFDGDGEWTQARIAQAMASSAEKHVRLTNSLPVHIVYFTAWVDEENGLSFLPDVYGHDRRQSAER